MAIIKLKPLTSKKTHSAPASVAPASSQDAPLEAIKIVVEMSDGSMFIAEGKQANAVWHYQMECEQLANSVGTMPSYMGPGLIRVPKP